MKDLLSKCTEILRAAEKATALPWEYGNEAVWNLEVNGEGNSPLCIAEFCRSEDGDFIALSRNLAPEIATALIAAIEVVEAASAHREAIAECVEAIHHGLEGESEARKVSEADSRLFKSIARFDSVTKATL